MSNAEIFAEGGETKQQQRALREAFRELFERTILKGRKPRVTPSGSRQSAYENFLSAFDKEDLHFAALLVDSEEPVSDTDKPWEHLKARDNWDYPSRATDENVFLMTTSTETWLIADPANLQKRFGQNFNPKSIPKTDLEFRDKAAVIAALSKATNDNYKKGEMTFEILGSADPDVLIEKLPSFARVIRILDEKLT